MVVRLGKKPGGSQGRSDVSNALQPKALKSLVILDLVEGHLRDTLPSDALQHGLHHTTDSGGIPAVETIYQGGLHGCAWLEIPHIHCVRTHASMPRLLQPSVRVTQTCTNINLFSRAAL